MQKQAFLELEAAIQQRGGLQAPSVEEAQMNNTNNEST